MLKYLFFPVAQASPELPNQKRKKKRKAQGLRKLITIKKYLLAILYINRFFFFTDPPLGFKNFVAKILGTPCYSALNSIKTEKKTIMFS